MSTKPSFKSRAAAVAAATTALVVSAAVLAGPASASVPRGWETSDRMSALDLLTFILFIPLAVAIIVSLLVLLPGVLRGEGLLPKADQPGTHVERDERVH